MRELELTQGKIARVDKADYEWLSKWKWFAFHDENGFWYAGRQTPRPTGGQITLRMHREIMKPSGRLVVDHEDNDGLNNQRYNLRVCTRSQNGMNMRLKANNSSGFKGVEWHPATRKWRARIRVKGKQISLGLFDLLETAAQAYDIAAVKHFGEFANLNFL